MAPTEFGIGYGGAAIICTRVMFGPTLLGDYLFAVHKQVAAVMAAQATKPSPKWPFPYYMVP